MRVYKWQNIQSVHPLKPLLRPSRGLFPCHVLPLYYFLFFGESVMGGGGGRASIREGVVCLKERCV